MKLAPRILIGALIAPALLHAQTANRGAPKVGPAKGTVMVVGGGGMGPEVYEAFIAAAGGPDALILSIPNAGGATEYAVDGPSTRGWKTAGAKNVQVLFTKDRKLADTDSFVAIIKKAGGIWFEGGRQWHIYNDYAGTKTEAEFNAVLARGGVVGGSSAGASILGDFLVRGAPSNDNMIMDHPQYEKGFAYLRGVGIDQHVVARERLPDLADSIIPKYPNLLGISEDEGTVWVVKGDTATIIGRNKAFAYGRDVKNDPGKPFITLRPGDKFNLATRQVMHRALEDSKITMDVVNSLFQKYSDPASKGATVLVAQNGKVLIDQSYGIPVQPRFTPETGAPLFTLGGIANSFTALCSGMGNAARGGGAAGDSTPARGRAASAGNAAAGANAAAAAAGGTRAATATTGAAAASATPPDTTAGRAGRAGRGGGAPRTPMQTCLGQLTTPVGMQRITANADGVVQGNVDDLYRFEQGMQNPRAYTGADRAKGWTADTFAGVQRLSNFGLAGGKKSAYVRIPSKQAVIIILTNDDAFDAKTAADKLTTVLVSGR